MKPANISHPTGKPVRGSPEPELAVTVELVVVLLCGAWLVAGDADDVLVVGAAAVGVLWLPASGSVYCVPPASWARAAAGTSVSAAVANRDARRARITGRIGSRRLRWSLLRLGPSPSYSWPVDHSPA